MLLLIRFALTGDPTKGLCPIIPKGVPGNFGEEREDNKNDSSSNLGVEGLLAVSTDNLTASVSRNRLDMARLF